MPKKTTFSLLPGEKIQITTGTSRTTYNFSYITDLARSINVQGYNLSRDLMRNAKFPHNLGYDGPPEFIRDELRVLNYALNGSTEYSGAQVKAAIKTLERLAKPKAFNTKFFQEVRRYYGLHGESLANVRKFARKFHLSFVESEYSPVNKKVEASEGIIIQYARMKAWVLDNIKNSHIQTVIRATSAAQLNKWIQEWKNYERVDIEIAQRNVRTRGADYWKMVDPETGKETHVGYYENLFRKKGYIR